MKPVYLHFVSRAWVRLTCRCANSNHILEKWQVMIIITIIRSKSECLNLFGHLSLVIEQCMRTPQLRIIWLQIKKMAALQSFLGHPGWKLYSLYYWFVGHSKNCSRYLEQNFFVQIFFEMWQLFNKVHFKNNILAILPEFFETHSLISTMILNNFWHQNLLLYIRMKRLSLGRLVIWGVTKVPLD